MKRLEGKVVVITGSAFGMGKVTAQRMAEEGAKIVVFDYNEAGAQGTAKEIVDAGYEATAFVGDVSKWEDVDAAINLAVEIYGQLDVMINNAGILDDFTPIVDLDNDFWQRIIDINLTGVMYGCKRAIQEFQKQGTGGNIINTASVGGLRGGQAGVAYTASKHGVIGITRTVATEVAKDNIRVNSICPGGIETEMTKDLMNTPEMQAIVQATVPMARFGVGEDVANGMIFLASDESKYITGTELNIDGGLTAK